jgi:DedD protein
MAVDEKVKKRLVGAVVLVSLAVIFIPMLLEERTPSSMPTFGSNVPPEPEQQLDTLDIPLQLPEEPPETSKTVVETQAEAAELEQVAKQEKTAQAKPAPAAGDKEEPQQQTESSTVSKAPSKKAGKADSPKGWVVQVGSFKESANAFRLRDRVRAKGYPAFVEQLRTGGDIIYRVRVGPELSRDKVDALRDRLASGMKLKGLVMSHP